MLSCRPCQRVTNAAALDAHEAGEADELDAGSRQRRIDGGIEGLARGVGLVIDGERLRVRLLRAHASPAHPGRLETTSDDLGRIVRRARRLDQRHHVGAAPGDQDGDALFHALASGDEARSASASAARVPLPSTGRG